MLLPYAFTVIVRSRVFVWLNLPFQVKKAMEKTVISFKIDQGLKDRLAELAKEQNRSLSNLIETVLLKYAQEPVEEKKTSKKK